MINLTKQEIKDITGAHWHARQIEILADLGIPCKIRPDGLPIVSRLAYEQAMGAQPGTAANDEIQPDFTAI